MSILTILVQEKDLLLEMFDTLNKEKEILINDDIKELEKIIVKKEELKYRIDEVENTRLGLCGDRKLNDILEDMDGKEKGNAEELGKEIESIMFKIQEVNNTNGLLIKQSLNYVRAVISAVTPAKPSVYNLTGRMEESNASSSILNKSV